ncbi:RICIN domain-containing protein [Streptomyces actinomycinicus]|uniref:RICIN domain-containing protein n=1 Tax=Streptomyces actinomycinicus TaxID=1695166 RepID=A0A937EI55_9ACTN|nr:RICIN domain-containing protein [Streptomyces actinomycinicus]MBL1083542.1 RICIN domain-containing protein [Streptomyces actinomycinicus]
MSTAQAAATGGEHSAPPISTVAGTGAGNFGGDGGPATAAWLRNPMGAAVDNAGTLYITDQHNHRVRKLTTDGKISTVAGTGAGNFGGDGGPATAAQLKYPVGVAVDSTGTVYIGDQHNHRVRKITPDGQISTVAGTGTANFRGDGGPATAAWLYYPSGVAVDSTGALYVADYGNHRVRKITPDGKISTVAGTGAAALGGDGGPATAAQLMNPSGVAVDSTGTLYIADYGNHRVRKITPDGKISTVAGTGAANFGGDGGPATAAQLRGPYGVVVDSTGALLVTDSGNHRVRKITPDGKISTVAGTGTANFGGDSGPATAAQLNNPFGLAVDCVDTVYITDHSNHRVRKVASVRMAGRPDSGTVVCWANVRSRLRMGVVRESTKDGAEIHQLLAASRDHQRWRLIAAGQDDGDVLYRIENVRSGKVLEVSGAQQVSGAVVAQRAWEGADAHHQQWRLIPVGSATGSPQVYEIANRNSGLLLRVTTNARAAITQDGSEADHQSRQWQLLPV